MFLYTIDAALGICDCPFGIGGKFCKHLCAVQQNFGVLLPNAPILTPSDKKMLAKLALGYDASEYFFENMDLDDSKSRSDNIPINKSPQRNIQKGVDTKVDFILETKKKESEVNRKHTSAVESLKENFHKLIEIASENNTADFTNCIIKANVELKKITTSTQLASFLCNLRKGRSSKQIGV
ncbi:unnamed protein product [Psylliodes chrysocephalus]|uniref:SWIM-type domain-containing protein n=1 Tax=Psylliodes chrysocephalus TaxID=3402493 RepID=A0A9P0D624_9CUCU|nr:unnamed protein product [Psylliodes chrysocephala]